MSPAQTVAETKSHKGRIARLGFFVAQNARTGHFAVTVCYMPFAILKYTF